jgi:zinc protease
MSRQILTGLLLATVWCCAAGAADKEKLLPKDLPPYGAVKPFAPPPVRQLQLANGLTVWLAPVDGFPKVSFALAVHGGYAADPKERPGIADLLASTVTQGTATRSARQLAEELQACGGDLDGHASTDYIVLQTSVLSEKMTAALNILGDIARNATFAGEEVKLAKEKTSSTLEGQEAEASFLGRRALYKAIFADHPYSVISPTKESIEKTSATELKHEYLRRFRPDQAILVVVGNFDSKTAEELVNRDFGGWQEPAGVPDTAVPPPAYSMAKTIFYVSRPNSVQTALYLGAIAPNHSEKDYEAAWVANAIYGGMFGSRLVLNIREDKGYTYSPYSYLSPYQATGLLVTRADVRNAVTGASLNEISYELNRTATTGPEPEELERAKRYAVGSLAIGLQSQAALASTLARYWIDSQSPQDLAEEGKRIEHVSPQEVQDAGRKYFPMWRMTTVAVGEEKVIKQELAPFGLEFKKVD